jgi:hypothetical protein
MSLTAPTLRLGALALCAAAFAFASAPLRAAEAELFAAFHPAAGKSTGGAVLIVPHTTGTADATQLARLLNARGLAAFVLRTPADAADFNRAVRTLRARAGELKISPTRIAALGLGVGAEVAADAAYNQPLDAKPDATDPLEKFSSRPDLLGLVWGGKLPADGATKLPPTFLVGTSAKTDTGTDLVTLWTKLRSTRTSVDAHLFTKSDPKFGLAADDPSLGTWPEMFFNWARFNGLLTDDTRLPLKGMVHLDGRVLPHGYVILTPIGFAGAGPIVGRVLNSTANQPLGLFTVPAAQGPVAGRYKVDVRQNMTRWLSNSFSGGLVGGRGGDPSPEAVHFGHHRVLAPSIDDQRSFTKVRPSDKDDYVIEIKPGADANLDLKIEVFSK